MKEGIQKAAEARHFLVLPHATSTQYNLYADARTALAERTSDLFYLEDCCGCFKFRLKVTCLSGCCAVWTTCASKGDK
jgi:hypothetical protein